MANSSKSTPVEAQNTAVPASPSMSVIAPAVAWLIPGAGHLIQKRWIRGLLIMASITIMFILGLLMQGRVYQPNGGDILDILGFVGDEPAGCARIRYFGDFAKIERLSVLSQYRRTKLKYQLVAFAEDLVRQKGFKLIYGHPQKRILNFWTKLGYEVVNRNFEFHYSDHDYTEMRKHLDPHPEQLTMHSDPMVLVRPEGHWGQQGILEHSMERPVTRPC